MKHKLSISILIVILFLIAQFIGLVITAKHMPAEKLPLGIEKPKLEPKLSITYITIFIIIGTLLAIAIARFSLLRLWKFWFGISLFIVLTISFGAFIKEVYAIILSGIITGWRILKPNILVHNISEMFVYGGIAAIFVPMLNIWAAIVLLVVISIYDYIAVRKTKHMIKLAKFQKQNRTFAGLFVPYKTIWIKRGLTSKLNLVSKMKGKIKENMREKLVRKTKTKFLSAILGGGDIGFTLLFSATVMQELGLNLLWAMIIPIFAGCALFLLFVFGKKGKFYPAMPYLSTACFLGYGIVLLLLYI